MFLMQFDYKMFKGFLFSIPVTVVMAKIEIIPQLFFVIIMKGGLNRFFTQ